MTTPLRYILLIALTIIIGTIVFVIYCCPCKPKAAVQSNVAQPVVDSPQSIKDKLNFDPLVIYFSTNESATVLSDTDKAKLNQFTDYLKQDTTAKLLCTGYSDNTGTDELNLLISKQRAEFAKQKLVAIGITADKIVTDAKGKENPIADNSTSAGRNKNRRTEITLK